MANLKYKDKHNQVALLTKLTGFEDFHPMVDFMKSTKLRYAFSDDPIIYDSLVRQFWSTATVSKDGKQIIAVIDNRKVTVTEDSVRNKLRLDDNGGIENLPDEDIYKGLGTLGYKCEGKLTFWKRNFSPQLRYLIHTILHCLCSKSGSADQFGSQTATALICLSNGTVYNYSKLIFDGMVQNAGNKKKFLQYPRFLQLILDFTPRSKEQHNIHYVTQKVFSFLRKNVEGEVAALPPAMLVGETHHEGDASPIRLEQENLDVDSATNTSTEQNNTSHAEPSTSSMHNQVDPSLVDVPVNEVPSTPIVAARTSHPTFTQTPLPTLESNESLIESSDIRDLKKKYRRLSKKVKKLETSLESKRKRRRIVLSDSEHETSEPKGKLWLLTVASEYANKSDSKECNNDGNSVELQDALDGPKNVHDSNMLIDVIPNSTVNDNPNPLSDGYDGNIKSSADVKDIDVSMDMAKSFSEVCGDKDLENSGIEMLDGFVFVNSNNVGSAETEVRVAEEVIDINIPLGGFSADENTDGMVLYGCSDNENTDGMGVSGCVDCSVSDTLPSGTSQTNVADVIGLSFGVDASPYKKSCVEHGNVKTDAVAEPNPVVDSNFIGSVTDTLPSVCANDIPGTSQTSVADVIGLSFGVDASFNENRGVEHGNVKTVAESNPVVDSNIIGGVPVGKNVNDDPICTVIEINSELDIKSFEVSHEFPDEESAEMKEIQEKITHDWLLANNMEDRPELETEKIAQVLKLAKHFNKAEWDDLNLEAQSCPYVAAVEGRKISDLKDEDRRRRFITHPKFRLHMRYFLKDHGSLPMTKSKDLTDKELIDLYKSQRRWNEVHKPIGRKDSLKKPETFLSEIDKGNKTMARKVMVCDKEKNELRPLLITEGKSESEVHIPLPCEATKKDDVVWDSQKLWKVVSWKLHNSTGVHTIKSDTGLVIHMLVYEKYPLKMKTLIDMLGVKLETDKESSMAYELVKSVQKQCQDTPDADVIEKSDVIEDVKILYKSKNSAAFQLIRKSGLDDIFKSVDAIMRGISRIDLSDLYKVLKNSCAIKVKQDPHATTLYEYLKTMFDTPPDENVFRMGLSQKLMGWIYFDSCGVHCLKLEGRYIYMLVERQYPLPVQVCKEMLGMKLMGKQDQVYSQIMQRIWDQANNA